jgi:hypothetical protein
MKWQPSFENPEEEQRTKTGYVSDNTTFMRWSTELETKDNVTDSDFMGRNSLQIMALDKFPALAFYEDPRLLRLRKRKLMNLILAQNLGLEQTCEEIVLSTIDDVQTSRGWKGAYSKALITQRHELDTKERTEPQKKAKWFNRFIGGKDQSEESQESRQ